MAKTFSNLGMPTSLEVEIIPPNKSNHFFISVTSEYFYNTEMSQILSASDQHLVNFEDLIDSFISSKCVTKNDRIALANYLKGVSLRLQEQS